MGDRRRIQPGAADGVAVWQTDMLLGAPADLSLGPGRSATVSVGDRWPDGRVRYRFADGFSDDYRARVVTQMSVWTDRTHGAVQFVEVAADDAGDYALITPASGVCNSYVGNRRAGAQALNLDPEGCQETQILHEIGHLLGLWHEQSRADRDDNVQVLWLNIEPCEYSNFHTVESSVSVGPYDFDSIMHYESHAFGLTDAEGNAMVTIARRDESLIELNTELSYGDVCGALHLYDPTQFQVYCVNEPGPSCVHAKGPFAWSCSGEIPGFECIHVEEPADPHTWDDNFLCVSPAATGIRWSYAGPIGNPNDACNPWECIAISEPNDPDTWEDNYLCFASCPCGGPCLKSTLQGRVYWSSDGANYEENCIKWDEPADPNGWDNNFLCWN